MKVQISFMERAIELAKKGMFTVTPNPMVGCVITQGKNILSEGYHVKAGSDHAEIVALKNLKKKINNNMVMYINLEPCCHQGKTGPCAKAIIDSGIKNVVVSILDPNPIVKGKGVKALRSNGVNVNVGLCKAEAKYINKGFISRVTKKIPNVLMKQAISIDYKITNPRKKWLSNKESRKDVQFIRAKSCAILVGSQTVIKDNPKLTVRLNKKELGIFGKKRNPIRVVLDTNLELDINKYDFFNGMEKKIVFNSISTNFETKKNIDFIKVKKNKTGLNLNFILNILAEKYEINNLMIEPGEKLSTALIENNLLDDLVLYLCPKIIGKYGLPASSVINNFYSDSIKVESIKKFSNDVRINYEFLRK